MSKGKKNTPPGKPEHVHLEETITHASDRVAILAKRLWVPVVVVAVTVIGILGLSSIYQWFAKSRQEEWAAEIFTAFKDSDNADKRAETRAALASLAEQLKGEPQESVFAIRFANWLWDQDGNPAEAVKVLADVKGRHPNDKVLEFVFARFSNTMKASEGFVAPTPPPPTPPPTLTPVPLEGTTVEPGGTPVTPVVTPVTPVVTPPDAPQQPAPPGGGGGG